MTDVHPPAPVPESRSLDALRAAVHDCRAWPLWEPATQAVFGEGFEHSELVLVGEQPGDREDVEGKPFVGPAGRVLDEALEEAGIVRAPDEEARRASMGELIAYLANVGRAMAEQDGRPR